MHPQALWLLQMLVLHQMDSEKVAASDGKAVKAADEVLPEQRRQKNSSNRTEGMSVILVVSKRAFNCQR